MAPNKRGGGLTAATSVITKEEIEARGSGTREHGDTYTFSFWCEVRVFLTGGCCSAAVLWQRRRQRGVPLMAIAFLVSRPAHDGDRASPRPSHATEKRTEVQ